MSCQLVSDQEIRLIAGLLVAQYDSPIKIPFDRLQGMREWAARLTIENYLAFNERYPNQHANPVPVEITEAMLGVAIRQLEDYSVIQLIKIVHHYQYQACDSSQFKGGLVARKLQDAVDTLVTNIEGYSKAPWGV